MLWNLFGILLVLCIGIVIGIVLKEKQILGCGFIVSDKPKHLTVKAARIIERIKSHPDEWTIYETGIANNKIEIYTDWFYARVTVKLTNGIYDLGPELTCNDLYEINKATKEFINNKKFADNEVKKADVDRIFDEYKQEKDKKDKEFSLRENSSKKAK